MRLNRRGEVKREPAPRRDESSLWIAKCVDSQVRVRSEGREQSLRNHAMCRANQGRLDHQQQERLVGQVVGGPGTDFEEHGRPGSEDEDLRSGIDWG